MQAPKVDVSHLMDKSNRAYRLMRVYRAVRESAGRLCYSYYHYVGINEMIYTISLVSTIWFILFLQEALLPYISYETPEYEHI